VEDRAVHDWYRFVLSFPPHLVRDYLTRFGMGPRNCVLDPFCGTGTVIVECKKLGVPSLGVEANPVAHFASLTKTDWNPDPDGLLQHARECAALASAKLEAGGTPDMSLFSMQDHVGPALLQELPEGLEKLLLKGSISPLPLHKALVLIQALTEHHDPRYANHERLALAKALVFSISNLHFGPEVGVGKPKPDAPVISVWLSLVRSMSEDLNVLASHRATPARTFLCDSRRILEVLGSRFRARRNRRGGLSTRRSTAQESRRHHLQLPVPNGTTRLCGSDCS